MRRAASGLRMMEKAEREPRRKRLKAQLRGGLRALFGEERLEHWSERLGLTGALPTEELSAGTFAAPNVAADLPLVYRRLFAADTMEAGDVLTGRNEEIRRAEAVLSSEVKGRLRSVVLVDPPCGGSTFERGEGATAIRCAGRGRRRGKGSGL
jgi:hypothetical protein